MNAFIILNIKTVTLLFSNNEIATIHHKAFWTSASNNKTTHTALKYLYVVNNNIKYIKSGTFDPLINLELLYLYNNKLSNIDNKFIVNLNKLYKLSIENNKLSQLPTKWLPNSLQYLDIRGNAIEYLTSNTFKGAYNINETKLSLNNLNIEYDTFSNLTKLTTIEVDPRYLEICTCTYIWYLNTKSNSTVCENINNKYASIREYLKEECQLPG